MAVTINHESQTLKCSCGYVKSIPRYVAASGEALIIYRERFEERHTCLEPRTKASRIKRHKRRKHHAPASGDRWQQLFAPHIKVLDV